MNMWCLCVSGFIGVHRAYYWRKKNFGVTEFGVLLKKHIITHHNINLYFVDMKQ